jgi:hypothetical protein
MCTRPRVRPRHVVNAGTPRRFPHADTTLSRRARSDRTGRKKKMVKVSSTYLVIRRTFEMTA